MILRTVNRKRVQIPELTPVMTEITTLLEPKRTLVEVPTGSLVLVKSLVVSSIFTLLTLVK